MDQILDAVEREMTRQALRQDGPLIDVTLRAKCAGDVECEPVRGKALIDTGADRTAVEWTAVDGVGAIPQGTYSAQGVTSEAITLPVYPLSVEFDGLGAVDVERAAATPHLKSQGLIALIGRDVLGQSQLTYDGLSGAYTLAMPQGSKRVESSSWKLPLVAVGGAVAVGAFAAWLFAPVCACDVR